MDEATANVDFKTEILIHEKIFSENRTILVVAHRMHTLHSVEKILLLDRGEIGFYGDRDDYF